VRYLKTKSENSSNTAFVVYSEAEYYVIKPCDEFRHTVGFRCISLCDCTAFRFRALSYMLCRSCNGELNDLYSLPNIVRVVKSRRMRWAGHVARMGEDRGVHRVLVGKLEGKRTLERPKRRWEDNIKMDLWEVGGGVVGTGWSWLRIGTGGGHLWVR
jgi:hypothetical protein